jgi:elongation factor G
MRLFSTAVPPHLALMRNIGIAAHVDAGKTTLTERILFYSGKIAGIHEVRGRDGVGATMDSMELERERGITIQSACTSLSWSPKSGSNVEHSLNLIDTPGHFEFSVEVERAMRVLDGAVLVLCGVGGIQSQTRTVNRQMQRWKVPRLGFINKMDRAGSDDAKVIADLATELGLHPLRMQLPVGEGCENGLIDLVRERHITFIGAHGEEVKLDGPVPADMVEQVAEAREEMLYALAEADEEFGMKFIETGDAGSVADIEAAIRRATISRQAIPVFMGTAYKNRGVQPLLDGVCKYLPSPPEVKNTDLSDVAMDATNMQPENLVGLAFKLEEGRFGQLTYFRLYEGTLRKGDTILNASRRGEKVRVPRIVKMHADSMEDVSECSAGDLCALFGVECNSGDTFLSGAVKPNEEGEFRLLSNMVVNEPVLSITCKPADSKSADSFTKGLRRFTREDPTFRVTSDPENGDTILSGMGELHLEIYVERLKREYNCETITGPPRVAYRETIQRDAKFDHTHKKQTGGSGQFAKLQGVVEPITSDTETGESAPGSGLEFVNKTVGGSVPIQYINAVEKGFRDACAKGPAGDYPVTGVRFVLQDGAAHSVDSSELAFRTAAAAATRAALLSARPCVLEPIMRVEILSPLKFQGPVTALVSRKRGVLTDTVVNDDNVVITASVPLQELADAFTTDLRSISEGRAAHTLEFERYAIAVTHKKA